MHVTLKDCLALLALGSAAAAIGFSGCTRPSDTQGGAGGGLGGTAAATSGGSSGSLGNGGSGDSTTVTPDAGPDAGFELNGAKWTLVPGSGFSGASCQFYQADPGTLTFPPLPWAPCGDGCDWADPNQGYSVGPATAVSANTEHGKAFLESATILKGVPWSTGIWRFVRLDDGVTVAALAEHVQPVGGFSPCGISMASRYTTIVSVSSATVSNDPTSTSKTLFGFAPVLPNGSWTWAQPPTLLSALPAGQDVFGTDGAVFVIGQGGVFGLLDPSSSAWSTLESPSDSMSGGGEGDLAIWTEWGSDRIRAWAPDGKGIRTLVEAAPPKTCHVKPSSTELVGVALDTSCDGSVAGAVRIWHAPRSYTQVPSVVVTPPIEPAVFVDGVGIRTRGDYAAVLAYDQLPGTGAAGHLLLVQLSTGKAWRVVAETGYVLQETTWTFDDTWLYYGETMTGVSDGLKLHRMRRIRLTSLDGWATPI